jgi:hypothetical protein
VTTDILLQLAVVVTAIAVLIGVLNLLAVHLGRISHAGRGWPYSLIALLTAAAVVCVYLLDRLEVWQGDLKGEEVSPVLFGAVQVSLESALAGMIFFFLVYAAYRLLRYRVSWSGLFFLTAVVVVLLGSLPVEGFTRLGDLRDWLMDIPVKGGERGLLIGIGLGTVVVGIRVLLGRERVYRES